jgi:hypothetical protein
MTQVQRKLRYTVGAVYFFIWINFTRNEPRWGSVFLPWLDTLNGIDIRKLTCREHHNVAWNQDPNNDKIHDGFIFTEEKSEHASGQWFNQYPAAGYGQLDDSSNWKVAPDLTVAEVEALPDNKVWAMHQDVTMFLSNAFKGVVDLKKKDMLLESKALADFCQKVVKLLKDDFQMEVCVNPMKLEKKDGTVVELEGFFDIGLKPIV